VFDPSEFNEILKMYGELHILNPDVSIPDPKNGLAYDQMNTYRSAVRKIWETQVSDGANNLAWDLINDGKCKALLKMVKARKARVRRANFAEKIDFEFSPFTTIDQVDNIEEWFWNNGSRSNRSSLAGLRNRFTFLSCYKAIL
jgi:hypothetical protein